MATVQTILDYLETIAPLSKKMEWDNCGLLCGRSQKEVKKILIALDPFEAVAQEAVDISADLILTHHPLIFRPRYTITDCDSIGRTIMLLNRNDIAAINAHTNLDVAPEGVNSVLAEKLGLSNIEVIAPTETDECGRQWGLLHAGTITEMPLEAFLSLTKETLGTPVLRYASCGKNVKKVAVGGGACAGELMEAAAFGCDTFVTSDAKYNDFWDAADAGINLIDAGHFYTENPVCTLLMRKMQEQFPEISVSISRVHRDCMKFY